ncbi:Outer membrane protein MIM1/TOM13 mitochondrial [Penicillium capsulatum]|uniref:Outer membrane protein MIM1/TOM13 mitochondrial n=1 Tax=Penicillium capsulatum TaxID=69766 RepID=A0A9W9IS40_9EURO|nr:Outer membrane protein MIM1/TOM13 mitochondrial [Penicillium capsulatum]KAJ6130389.1 Outer membrane protein MIM1/TOM13 mitochondrial [Penicillium capsulatum]
MSSVPPIEPFRLFDDEIDEDSPSADDELSPTPSSTASSRVVLYNQPSVWGLLRGAAINFLFPFINGMMLGFGELFAHELAFRLGWQNTRVLPVRRRRQGRNWVHKRDGPKPGVAAAGLGDISALE